MTILYLFECLCVLKSVARARRSGARCESELLEQPARVLEQWLEQGPKWSRVTLNHVELAARLLGQARAGTPPLERGLAPPEQARVNLGQISRTKF